MSSVEGVLLWLVALIALGLGGYSVFQTAEINKKGRKVMGWATEMYKYALDVDGHIHKGTAALEKDSHISPPPEPPTWD